MKTSSNLAEKMNNEELNLNSEKTPVSLSLITNPLDELLNRKTIRQHIKEFAGVLGVVFLGISAYSIYKNYSVLIPSIFITLTAVLLVLGYKTPSKLLGFWKGWLAIGNGIGTVVTFFILSMMWTVMFIPIAIGLKIFSKQVMDLSFRNGKESYWEDRNSENDNFLLLERQY